MIDLYCFKGQFKCDVKLKISIQTDEVATRFAVVILEKRFFL